MCRTMNQDTHECLSIEYTLFGVKGKLTGEMFRPVLDLIVPDGRSRFLSEDQKL